jgi:hypothetical protein
MNKSMHHPGCPLDLTQTQAQLQAAMVPLFRPPFRRELQARRDRCRAGTHHDTTHIMSPTEVTNRRSIAGGAPET